MPRAPRMFELFYDWNEPFRFGNLFGEIIHGDTCSGTIAQRGYRSSSVVILDGNVVVLQSFKHLDDAPRTNIYSAAHSEQLDAYMDALSTAIRERQVLNDERVRLDNERRAAKQIYEEGLF